jgi:hypothetical protein
MSSTSSSSSSRSRRLLWLVVAIVVIGGGGALWLASLDDDKATTSASSSKADDGAKASADAYAGMTTYLTDHASALVTHTEELRAAADDYAAVVAKHDGDYEAVAKDDADAVRTALAAAREAFVAANPSYEEMEGIVAGVPSLSKYDVSIDAGASAKDDPENAVEFDVKVDDERTLEQPGNYFLLAESTLYGTDPAYSSGVAFDVDDDGATTQSGDLLPDAAVLKAVTTDFAAEAARLEKDADAYEPTEADAFTALVVMTPTMGEYFESWKQSRFVAGDKATEKGFVAASRLSDVVGILTGLEVIRESLEPRMEKADPAASKAVEEDLASLTTFVDDLRTQEADGKRFTAAEADRYGADAQSQAEQVTARVTDIARELGVQVDA